MHKRIMELEDSISSLRIDMAVIKANYASKLDLQIAKNQIILKDVGCSSKQLPLSNVIPVKNEEFDLHKMVMVQVRWVAASQLCAMTLGIIILKYFF
ncbi:hypothetical protein [Pantoea sp.]|uniref:hypothetical protein n=1 Tax=Pantoea sp. TaxID=69393 RepID=UPI0031D6FB1B